MLYSPIIMRNLREILFILIDKKNPIKFGQKYVNLWEIPLFLAQNLNFLAY